MEWYKSMTSFMSDYQASIDNSYHQVLPSMKEWIEKAITSDGEPPKSKHVRRIILSVIRDPRSAPEMLIRSILGISGLFLNPNQSYKAIYILMITTQHESPVANIDLKLQVTENITGRYNQSITSDSQADIRIAVQRLASAFREKLSLHKKYPNLNGNLSQSQVNPTEVFINDLIEYLARLHTEVGPLLYTAQKNSNFLHNVCLQPILEELLAVSRHLYPFRSQQNVDALLRESDKFLDTAEILQFVSSAVNFKSVEDGEPQPWFPK